MTIGTILARRIGCAGVVAPASRRGRRAAALVAVAVAGFGGAATAGRDRPVRSVQSENGRFELRVRPGHPSSSAAMPCRGVLIERDSKSRRRETRWEADLVNDMAPTRAFVRDDGRYVVTLDEYRFGGARHAVVIYDAAGRVAREFSLNDLLGAEDMPNVCVDGAARIWLDGAKFSFDDQRGHFVIVLAWGREIRIELDSQRVVSGTASGRANATARGSAASGDASEARRGQGSPSATAEMEPNADRPPEFELMLEALAELFEGDSETSTSAGEEMGWGDAATDLHEDANRSVIERVGVAMPRPDPVAPVDYIAWINTYTAADDPTAEMLLRSASDATVPADFDSELLTAALEGDADALEDSLVRQWLADNRSAAAAFLAAAAFEFNGYELHSEDGTLVGALLPTLSNLRELARVTVVNGKLLELEGRWDEAAEQYVDLMAAGSQTGRGVTLIESLVGTAIESFGANALLDAYAADAGLTFDYTTLAERIAAADRSQRDMAELMQFERAMVNDVAQRLYEPDSANGGIRPVAPDAPMVAGLMGLILEQNGVAKADFVRQLEELTFAGMVDSANAYYDDITAAMQLPYQDAAAALDDIESQVSDPAFIAANPVLGSLLPSFSRAAMVKARGEATRRATLLIAQLRAYRQRFGRYPDSLDAFGGADFTTDPYTGASFAYRRDGDDFVLYSLGHNGVDDGGQPDENDSFGGDLRIWPRPTGQ